MTSSQPYGRARVLLIGAIGGTLAGWALTWITVGLNPNLLSRWSDPFALALWFCVPASVLGAISAAVLMTLTELGWRLTRRVRSGHPSCSLDPGTVPSDGLRFWIEALLISAPAGAVLALPDVGLSGTSVSDALLGGKVADWIRFLGLLLLFVTVATLVGRVALVIKGRRGRSLSGCVLLGVLAFSLVGRVTRLQEQPSPAARVPEGSAATERHSVAAIPASTTAVAAERVVLLNIDGLDPGVIEALGPQRLPFFWSLRQRGTYGHLKTEVPTLSPPIWTTLVTGRSRRVHGIRGFLFFQLPGLSQPVWQFPLHSGLNFKLLPWIDRHFGPLSIAGKPLVAQYRSGHRREPALWEILEGVGPIGVYRWRVTWPAEHTPSFVVAEGVSQTMEEKPQVRSRLGTGYLWPEDVLSGLAPRLPGQGVDVVERLVGLIDKYQTRLTIAGFSSVDGIQHRFGLDWHAETADDDDLIAARYQEQDERLAELNRRLGPQTDLIIVSDHGFSFEHGHHARAPDGAFFAVGPSFPSGRLVRSLSIYDIAPLVIDLFGVGQSEELPGVQRDAYPRALKVRRSATRVASYPERTSGRPEALEDDNLEETKDRLRGLGYIQ